MGNQARIAASSTAISTSTRNFPNRQGQGIDVFLSSAELAAVASGMGKFRLWMSMWHRPSGGRRSRLSWLLEEHARPEGIASDLYETRWVKVIASIEDQAVIDKISSLGP
jgi:hypothetical protein